MPRSPGSCPEGRGLNLTRCAALTRGRSGQPAIQPAHPGAHAGPHAVQVADIGNLSSTSVHTHAARSVTAGAHSPSTRERSSGHIDGFPFCRHHWPAGREVKPVRSHLADQTGVLVVASTRCDRAGRYGIDTLINRQGRRCGVPEWAGGVGQAADCPKRKSVSAHDLWRSRAGALSAVFLGPERRP
jgi:hypothetical protein